MIEGKCLMDKAGAEIKMQRMALEIAEELSNDAGKVIIYGIEKSGTVIAETVGKHLMNLRPDVFVEKVVIDKHNPKQVQITGSHDLNKANVIIADDVSNSGRTLLYALKPLMDFYPRRIQTLVLVERMHKLFPINPDYVGLSVATTHEDHISVEVSGGVVEGAYLQ